MKRLFAIFLTAISTASVDAGWKSGDLAKGEICSPNASLEPFVGANWIGDENNPAPAFARDFTAEDVTGAVLHVTGVGYCETRINGCKVGRAVLEPTPTDYSKRVLYSTYDVSRMIRPGVNEIRLLLGNGLYNVQATSIWDFCSAPWRGFPRGIAVLELKSSDGVSRVVTDASWRVVASPVLFNDFREGEVVASEPDEPAERRQVSVVAGPGGVLERARHPSSEIVRTYPVVGTATLPDGAVVYDFGANITGWVRIRFSGLQRGDVISICYDERFPGDGNRVIDRFCKNLPSQRLCPSVDPSSAGFQTDRFIASGKRAETYEPRFTYNGFRYVTLRGARQLPAVSEVTGCFIRTAFPKRGSFACSNETFNRLVAAAELAYEGNFTVGFPTDCPHREKNGWLGDAAAAVELGLYAYGSDELVSSYRNWIRTIADQQTGDGCIPSIVPTSGWGLNAYACSAGPAWGCALTTIPLALYRFWNDRETLEDAYPAMCRYVDKLMSETAEICTYGLGDWMSPVTVDPAQPWTYRTTLPFTSTAYAYRSVCEMVAAAEALRRPEDAVRFAARADRIKTAFNAAFYRGDGVYEGGYMCSQAMPLAFGLVPEAEVSAVRRQLVCAAEKENGKIDFGLLGSTVVFRMLSESGAPDLAWRMVVGNEERGMACFLANGGTTLWENFSGTASLNHVMFGDFVAWAFATLAGVRPLAPGYGEFAVDPVPPMSLEWACATVPTPRGDIRIRWRRAGGVLRTHLTVPEGSCAHVAGHVKKLSAGEYDLMIEASR